MGFFVALQFLTTIPSPLRKETAAGDLAGAVAYFPLVGMLLGLGLAGLDAALGLAFPPTVQSALLVVALVILTGGMHLDGLMDTCDGVFHHSAPERRLEIMRDSRVGAFGVVGAVSVLLVKYAALLALPAAVRPGGLILMAATSRLAMAYCLVAFPYARPGPGLGRLFQGGTGKKALALGTAFVAAVGFWLFREWGPIILGAAGVLAWGLARYIGGKIGGLTGDTYGAIDEVTEVVVLLGLSVMVRFGVAPGL